MSSLILAEEPFYSIQGEGRTTGWPAVFIRTAGCPVRCFFCDSSFTFKKGTNYTFDRLLEIVREHKAARVVLTGGEPMMQPNSTLFLRFLRSQGIEVEVETSGIFPLPEQLKELSIQWNVSPKLPSAMPKKTFKNEVIKEYIQDGGNLKFVVTDPNDINLINKIVEELEISPTKVWLMPQGYTRKGQLNSMEGVVELCKKHNYNFGSRLHILIYDYKQRV